MNTARRLQLRSYIAPVLLALVAIALAGLSSATVLWLDVGSAGDARYVEGFYRGETNAHETFRWSDGESTLALPVNNAGTYRIDLSLAVFEPAGRTLEIGCGQSRHSFALDGRAGNGALAFDCNTTDDTLRLSLSVPPVQLGPDQRELGISVRDVRVTALGRGDAMLVRAGIAIAVAATLIGSWFALGAIGSRRFRLGLTVAIAAGWLGLVLARPDWILAAVSGPGGLLALIGGVAAWRLAGGSNRQARILALLGLLVLVVMRPQPLALTLPSRWVESDMTALRLLPWLAGGAILIAALTGGRRSRFLAAAGAGAGLLATGLPVFTKLVADRWSMALAVPDWTDRASIAGAVYLAALAVVVVVGVATARHERVLGVVPIVALGLACLLGWRVAVMDFNGDEPHYYVTARSLGTDHDLELLNNYHESSYRRNTISPDGNIAVVRDASADRYSAIFPPDGHGLWYLDGDPGTVREADGSVEWLPPLHAAESVVLAFSGECAVEDVSVGAPDGGSRDLHLALRGGAGQLLWESRDTIDGVGSIAVSGACAAGPASLTIDSQDGPIVAQAVDTFGGLKVLPARAVGDVSLLASLPHDRYASRNAATELTIHNPGSDSVEAVVTMLGPDQSERSELRVEIPAGGTKALQLRSQGLDAIVVEPAEWLVVEGVGRIWAGAYALPEPAPLDQWSIGIPADGTHDAGVWLSLSNAGTTDAQVTLADGDDTRVVKMCAGCYETVLLPAEDDVRQVVVSTADADVTASGVEYQERTGALHFDSGLPLLAALPARFGGPKAVLIVPALAALAMAPGLVLLLTKVGVGGQWAAVCAAGMVLLAPISTYAVRLYTEMIAACLLVWAVVLLDAARRRVGYLLPLAAITFFLPLLHGRFVVFSAVFVGLVALQGIRRARRLDRRTLATLSAGLVVLAVLAFVLVRVTVGLRERVTASYIATNWADIGLIGVLFDRGSGLLPFAPWLVLALFVPRPLQPVQRVALGLILIDLAAVIVRAGGWQTWGAPARYILPIVPLMALLVGPALQRLWERRAARPAILFLAGWGVVLTFMLQWLPLSGYIRDGRYLVDEAWRGAIGFSPMVVFPKITPAAGSFVVGTLVTFGLLGTAAWLLLVRGGTRRDGLKEETPQRGVSTVLLGDGFFVAFGEALGDAVDHDGQGDDTQAGFSAAAGVDAVDGQ